MRLKKRLLALVLMAVLIVPGALSPVLPVCAGGAAAGGLLGSGAADEINIVRILDMALNKAGMSMSPSKIREFLNYWWESVQSDIWILLSDAGTTITTASDFVDYIASAASDPTKADGLEMVDLTLKFARFCITMEFKTLSDFKNLLMQEGVFRRFLLSYVTDQDSNIAGTINNNKLVKYQLKPGFITMVRQAADCYIEDHEGYYLVKTHKPSDLLVNYFSNKAEYDEIRGIMNTIDDDMVISLAKSSYAEQIYYLYDLSNSNFVFVQNGSGYIGLGLYGNDWVVPKLPRHQVTFKQGLLDSGGGIKLSEIETDAFLSRFNYYIDKSPFAKNDSAYGWIFTKDGRAIKVWKTMDGFKSASVGQSGIYYASGYGTFNESKDTGLTFTGAYYNGSYSHDTIQSTIDNSQTTVDNSVVNNIVNNYITNNYGDETNSGGTSGGDSSGGSGNWWDIGDGITSFVKGVAALLDFLLKLLGDLIGVISEFLVGLLAVLEKLGAVGSSFGDFLKAFFGFLPEEVIDMMVVSIGFIVVAGVIKMFKG